MSNFCTALKADVRDVTFVSISLQRFEHLWLLCKVLQIFEHVVYLSYVGQTDLLIVRLLEKLGISIIVEESQGSKNHSMETLFAKNLSESE